MPSSSLFQGSSTTLISALLLSSSVYAAAVGQPPSTVYKLDIEYSGSSFFDGFNFFTGADPTHGFVDYVSYSDAQSAGLISTGSSAIMRVDDTTIYKVPPNESSYAGVAGVGRKSVRIESRKSWTHGLIIADFKHMPTTSVDGCGTWPAFWTLGSGDWPYNGELDIIEGANDQAQDLSSAHTGDASGTRQCRISNAGGSAELIHDNCNLFTTGPYNTSTNPDGCGVSDTSGPNYGTAFNSNGGGVYAMDWTSSFIKLYFFPRGSIPSDISYGWPDPSNWGTPYAVFGGDGLCDIDANFADMRIIFDNTFCGDFGSATWGSGCAAKTGVDQCYKYVPVNPSAFTETYWDVSYVKVYQQVNTTWSPWSNSSSSSGSSGSPGSPGSSGSPGSPSSSGSSGSPGSSGSSGSPGSSGSYGSPGSPGSSGSYGSPGPFGSSGSSGSGGPPSSSDSFSSSDSSSSSGSSGSFSSSDSSSSDPHGSSGSPGSSGSFSSSGSSGSSWPSGPSGPFRSNSTGWSNSTSS